METATTAIVILACLLVSALIYNLKKQWDISELKEYIKNQQATFDKTIEKWKESYNFLKAEANNIDIHRNKLKDEILSLKTSIQEDYFEKKMLREQATKLYDLSNGLRDIIQKQSAALELAEGELAKRLTERQYKKYSKERGAYNAELKREPNLEKYESEYTLSDEYGKYKIEKVELSPREIEDGYIMKLERVYEPQPKN